VGSGLGLFVAEASDAGWSPTGLELSPHGREFASRRLDADVRSGFDEVASGSIGIVRASHVLEHIPAPRTFLDDCRRVLEPRGVMLVIVPHREPLVETVLNRARRARGNRELAGAIYPDMHVLGFDHVSLPALMSRAGFEQVWLRGVGMGDPTFYPWFYDDLVHVLPFRRWAALGWRYCVPRIVNRLAAPFGRGDWIAGLFRRRD
jgi:SAM-dependent methyltransferase